MSRAPTYATQRSTYRPRVVREVQERPDVAVATLPFPEALSGIDRLRVQNTALRSWGGAYSWWGKAPGIE